MSARRESQLTVDQLAAIGQAVMAVTRRRLARQARVLGERAPGTVVGTPYVECIITR